MTYRPGRSDDLDACTLTWKAAIEDYQARLAQPPLADDLAVRRLLAHALATDPARFWVAVDGEGTVAGFSSATVREGLWFLAMLFVRPGVQARGAGQALMDRAQAGRDAIRSRPVRGPDEPLDSGIHTGACARTRSNLSPTRCTPGEGWCRASRSGDCSGRCGAGPPCPCSRWLAAVPFEALAAEGSRRSPSPGGGRRAGWTTS